MLLTDLRSARISRSETSIIQAGWDPWQPQRKH
jgi:hypothetical protein